MTVRGCSLDSGTLTIDTELTRTSSCGAFYFGERFTSCHAIPYHTDNAMEHIQYNTGNNMEYHTIPLKCHTILYKTCNSMHHLSSRNNHFWISLTWNAPGCFDMSSLSDMCVAVFKVAATPTVATLPPKLGSSQYSLFASWELSFLFGSDQFCRHTRPRSKAKSSLVSRPTIWSLLLVFGFLARWSG